MGLCKQGDNRVCQRILAPKPEKEKKTLQATLQRQKTGKRRPDGLHRIFVPNISTALELFESQDVNIYIAGSELDCHWLDCRGRKVLPND